MGGRSRRRGPAALSAALLILATAAPALGQTGPAPFANLVDQIHALFPKVSGEVINVQGDQIMVSVGKRDGLTPGVELSLYREGRELRHPKTGEVLGRTEESLGRARVTRVLEQYSLATVLAGPAASPGETLRVGDRARVSAGKIRLTLVPLSSGVKDAQVEAAVQELSAELGKRDRFQVVAGDAVSVRLAESGTRPEDALAGTGLSAAARGLGAEYLLPVLFKRVQRKPFMEVRLFSDPGAPPLLSTALFVPPSVKPQPRGQFSGDPSARPEKPAKQRSLLARLFGLDADSGAYSSGEGTIPLKEVARLGFPVITLDVTVAPKDRVPRLVITDGEMVYVYRIVNQSLEPDWTFNARAVGRIVSVQLADLDGDGVLEVVANRWDSKAGMSSFVLTAPDGKPRYLVDSRRSILIAVDAQGDGVKRTLWAQDVDDVKFFTRGQADEVKVKDGGLVVARAARVPSSFRATGAVYSSIAGKDRRSLAFIDETHRLVITVDGQEMWQSAVSVGGGNATIEMERGWVSGSPGRSFFFKMEPMPLAVDLDGDGIDEIVVPQNVVREGLLAVVFKSPAGYRIQSINSGFDGPITGLGAFKTDDSSQPTLIAAVVRFKGLFKSSGETQIIMTVPDE